MIALDAMGGDYAPHVTVQGAINAARSRLIPITLFGDQSVIENIAYQYDAQWQELPISVIHCAQTIDMTDRPTSSFLHKSDSSLVQAMKAVKQGQLRAIVSAGNSGACLVSAVLLLGRIPGILRPALASFVPTIRKAVLCLDLGANVDCKPDYLLQFAYMGASYVSVHHQIALPRVALLSNGAEAYKGSEVVKKAYGLLRDSALCFVGNIEPRDLFDADIDVLVCDGFAGNIMLKTMQGTAQTVKNLAYQLSTQSLWYKISAFCSKPLWRRMSSFFDYSKKGGAILLGVPYPCIVTHGSSNAQAIEYALYQAYEMVSASTTERFVEKFCHYNAHTMCSVQPYTSI